MKVPSILKYVFSIVGVALFVGTLMSYKSTSDFLEEAVSVQGTVVALAKKRSEDSVTYRPVVEFVTGNGEEVEFTSTMGTNPPRFSVGEQVEVLYLPAEPGDAKINDFADLWWMTIGMAGMGIPFFAVGALIFLIGKFKNRKKASLQRTGVAVEAQFQSVVPNNSISMNGRNPFVIVCHWLNPVTSQVHVFESENIWFDPSRYIDREKLTVFMNKGNPKKYYVDVSFLPKQAR